jgi:RIO kinase 2
LVMSRSTLITTKLILTRNIRHSLFFFQAERSLKQIKMVKFDLKLLVYLEPEDFRVLSAVETGMRNHHLVPAKMVCAIAELRSGTSKIIRTLCYNRLLSYERGKRFDGYRLTSLGYDYLALRVLRNRGRVDEIGNQIGVGKEASVYMAGNRETSERFALKVHRLGRTSFKTVFSKRDYHKNRVCNWLYMSRLAALREYAFMKALYQHDFSVPEPIDQNRHCVLMRWIDGTLLNNVSSEDSIDHEKLFGQLMDMILELANKYGVVHGDFNEFNILIENGTDRPVLIDFPQMVPTSHKLAKEYFERDVGCVVSFFEKRFDFTVNETLTFDDVEIDDTLDSYIHQGVEDADFLHAQIELMDNAKEAIVEEEEDDEDDEDDEDNEDEVENDNENSKQGQGDLKDKPIPVVPSSEEGEEQFEDAAEQFDASLPVKPATDAKVTSYLNDQAEMLSKLAELGIKAPERAERKQSECSSNDSDDRFSMASQAPSRYGGSSVASSFSSIEIRSKLRQEKDRKIKRELIQKTFRKVKGDSSATGRKRIDNKGKIKEDMNIYEMF